MYVVMSLHSPRPEYREVLIESMHRFGAAMKGGPGLISVHTLADDNDRGRLVGLALFESHEAAEALLPLARAAVKDDDFDLWESGDIAGFRLREV